MICRVKVGQGGFVAAQVGSDDSASAIDVECPGSSRIASLKSDSAASNSLRLANTSPRPANPLESFAFMDIAVE